MFKLPSNCIPTYRQICRYCLTKVSLLHPLLSCLEKEGSVFIVSPFLLSFVPPHTPCPVYCPCWLEDRKPLSDAINVPSYDCFEFCAIFCMYTKYEGIGCDSLLTAWSVLLNVFGVFGDFLSLWQAGGKRLALLVQVHVKFKLINTSSLRYRRDFFQKRTVKLPVCLRLIPRQEDMVEVPRLVQFRTNRPVQLELNHDFHIPLFHFHASTTKCMHFRVIPLFPSHCFVSQLKSAVAISMLNNLMLPIIFPGLTRRTKGYAGSA